MRGGEERATTYDLKPSISRKTLEWTSEQPLPFHATAVCSIGKLHLPTGQTPFSPLRSPKISSGVHFDLVIHPTLCRNARLIGQKNAGWLEELSELRSFCGALGHPLSCLVLNVVMLNRAKEPLWYSTVHCSSQRRNIISPCCNVMSARADFTKDPLSPHFFPFHVLMVQLCFLSYSTTDRERCDFSNQKENKRDFIADISFWVERELTLYSKKGVENIWCAPNIFFFYLCLSSSSMFKYYSTSPQWLMLSNVVVWWNFLNALLFFSPLAPLLGSSPVFPLFSLL